MTTAQPAYRTLSIFAEDPVLVGEPQLEWVPARRRLGISAFGTNAFRAGRAGEIVIEEHRETPGQEELYVVVRGSAEFTVGDEIFEAGAGMMVFVSEPGVTRRALALEDDTAVLAVGGWTGRAYHSLPWEPIYLAQEAMRAGDWAAAAETLEREAGEHLDTGIVQFRLACCYARLGRHDVALAQVRRAIEINPDFRGRVDEEEHLAPLRELPGWPDALGGATPPQ